MTAGADERNKPEARTWLRRVWALLRRLGPTGPVAVAAAALPALGGLALYGRLHLIGPWLRDRPAVGPFAAAAAFTLLGGVALAPTYAMSALCGWSFGFAVGLATTLAGFVSAACVAYGIGRSIDRGRVARLLSESPRWGRVYDGLVTGGSAGRLVLLVALVRLAPVAPFSLTNLLMSAARVPLAPFATGTLLGMAPRTALIVWAASRLSSADATPTEQPWLFATAVAATAVAAAGIGVIGKRALDRVTANAGA